MGSADHTSTNMYTPHLSLLVPVLLLLLPPHHVQGYSSGAPVGQCDSMVPEHSKTEPMDPTTSPYTIQVAAVKMFNSETLNVSLISDTGEYFEGFLLKAVSIDDGKTVGTFNILKMVALMNQMSLRNQMSLMNQMSLLSLMSQVL